MSSSSKHLRITLPLIALVAFLHIFGWLHRDRQWESATGWDTISEEWLPPGGISHHLFADDPDRASIYWLGHSGFLIQWGDTRVLLDPNANQRCSISRRFLEPAAPLPDQPIDVVCISHAHYDHLDPGTLEALPAIRHLIFPERDQVYFPDILPGDPLRHGLKVGSSVQVNQLTINAVAAKHNGCRHHPWRSSYIALGYVISDGSHALYFAGDTAMQPEVFDHIRQTFAPQTAILPIGAFAPRVPLKIHHLSPREAVETALDMGVDQLIPTHFGTFRMSLDWPHTALPRMARHADDLKQNWIMPVFYNDSL